jgi:lipopolysaccharide export system permease protein
MIIARYLNRQILLTTLAITLVLLLVVVSGRLANYIAQAAEGRLAATLLFPVVVFRMPQFLELILPASLLLGIIVSLGHLYETNEMTVMSATGVSQWRVLRITLIAASLLTVIVAMFSFYLSPKGYAYVNRLIEAQGLQSELGSLAPETFYELENRGGTIYAGEVSSDRDSMSDVFVFRPESDEAGEGATVQTIIHAQKGYQEYNDNGAYYFVLEDGVRYEGMPGQADFTITQFDRYSQKIERPSAALESIGNLETATISQLLASSGSEVTAELHWRISLPVMTMLLAFLAVPLSRSSPRQGRYLKLLPGLIFYLVYVVLINAGRDAVSNDEIDPLVAIWGCHLLVFLIALTLFSWRAISSLLFIRAPASARVRA